MSTEFSVAGTPVGPPWSVDDLADIHAGVYPAEITAELRTRIAADPDAAAVFAALDSTVDELSLLPPLVIPEQYARRLDQAIAAESLARSEGRTSPLVTGSFSALLAPGAGTAAQPGLPRIAPPAGRTPSSALPPAAPPGTAAAGRPLVAGAARPGGPPPRHAPMIPRVLPSAPVGRPVAARADAPPPYAPAPSGPGAAGPAGGPSPAGPPRQAPAGRALGATGPGRVSSLDAQRSRRRRWVGGLAVAAAAAAIATFSIIGLNSNKPADSAAEPGATVTLSTTVGPGSSGGPAPSLSAFAVEKGKFQEAFTKVEGTKAGALGNPITAASCFQANGITGTDVLGVSDVTYETKAAYAIAVADPSDAAKARLLVVGLTCGPDGAQLLAQETVVR